MTQPLTSVKQIKVLLSQFGGIRPNHSLGQNFLVSERILRQLIDAAELTKNDFIIEPGAGIGTVTIELARRARRVIAYELDPKLIPILKHNINQEGVTNVDVRNEDVLQAFRFIVIPDSPALDLDSGIRNLQQSDRSRLGGRDDKFQLKLVGSIPYSLTSPLIHEIIYHHEKINSATLIIQREVAEKIVAIPPQASYLSNFVQLFADIQFVEKSIPPSAFWPKPQVESALVRFMIYDSRLKNGNAPVDPEDWSNFLHRGFSQPRKMLKKVFPEEALEKAEANPTARPQELSLKEWQKLFLLQAKK